MKHVLVVDDDIAVRRLVVDYLSHHALRVTAVGSSHEVSRVFATDNVDLVLVDLNLGKEDGLEIVRDLTAKSDTPIIIMTGARLKEADKVIGLELGAIDYVAKPFSMRELLARVRAGMRERRGRVIDTNRRSYTFSGWVLSLRNRSLTSATGRQTRLTMGEFNLLVALLTAPREILSRDQLLSASRPEDEDVFDRSIDVLILRLRKKLEENPSCPALIKTERGTGYFLDAEVRVEEDRRR